MLPRFFAVAIFLGLLSVGLSAEPQESIPSIKARYERQRQELSQRLRTQKVDLMKLMAVDDPESQRIKDKVDQILETERQRQHLFVDEIFSVRSSMSEEEWRDYRRSIIMMMMNKNQKR